MRGLFSLFVIGVLGAPALAAEARAESPGDRHGGDLVEVHRMRIHQPDAERLLRHGEAAYARGDVAGAYAAFQRAFERAPESALVERRLCQARTELGYRRDAVDSCLASLGKRRSLPGSRALVAALMSGPPTPEDLTLALLFAEQMKKERPEQPWGYAADADIAVRLGDPALLGRAARDLQRVAPGHHEARRAARLAAREASAAWIWALWAALAASALITAAHALLRSRRFFGRRLRARAASAVALAILFALPAHAEPDPGGVPAGGMSKFRIDPANPSAAVPPEKERMEDPLEFGYLLMDLTDLAEQASKKDDHAQAAKYYEATVRAVPAAAVGYRKACEAHERAGNREAAVALCRGALSAEGAKLEDHARFTRLALAGTEPLTPRQIEDLDAVVLHLRAQPGAELTTANVECEIGTRLEDEPRLSACTAVLARLAPDDPRTVSFQWALALRRGDWDGAERLVARARETRMKPEGLAAMQRAIAAERSLGRRIERNARAVALGALAAAALAALGAGFRLAARRRARLSPT